MNITANRSHIETWRIQRVEKTIRLFCTVFGVTEQQAEFLIRTAHDHKGELEVEWYDNPTDEQKNAMKIAWGMVGETNVSHTKAEVTLVKDETF